MSILAETMGIQTLSVNLQVGVNVAPQQYAVWYPGGKFGELHHYKIITSLLNHQMQEMKRYDAYNRATAPFIRGTGGAAKISTITNAICWGYHTVLDIV